MGALGLVGARMFVCVYVCKCLISRRHVCTRVHMRVCMYAHVFTVSWVCVCCKALGVIKRVGGIICVLVCEWVFVYPLIFEGIVFIECVSARVHFRVHFRVHIWADEYACIQDAAQVNFYVEYSWLKFRIFLLLDLLPYQVVTFTHNRGGRNYYEVKRKVSSTIWIQITDSIS